MRASWMTLGLAAAAGLAAGLAPRAAHAQWKTPWSYNGPRGPAHWGALDPEYALCTTGKEQSPIDIRATEHAKLPPLRFDFVGEPLRYLINNGATIRVNYHDAASAGSFLTVGATRYQLTQFHFHRPAEELVNGHEYPMEAHFMLKAADGAVAGVTVFLNAGKPSATVQKLWDHMPMTESKELNIPGVEVNPAALLPHELGYYMYMGSVTAPPCTEGVTWYVLETPMTVSNEQIRAFAALYPHDARPVQPLNGRTVKATP